MSQSIHLLTTISISQRIRLSLPLLIILAGGLVINSCSDFGHAPTVSIGGTSGQLSVADVTATEGSAAGFNVTISAPIDSVVRFVWTVTPRSASAGDFSGALTGADSITAGATNEVISIQTVDDTASESSELFVFALGSPVNATISRGTAYGLIAPNDGGVDLSWSASVKPLFSPLCTSCHPSNGGGFDVSSPTTLMTTGSHSPNVIPGNGSGSNLIDKLSSASPAIGGSQMPLGNPPYSAGTIDIIRKWIDQGAQNN